MVGKIHEDSESSLESFGIITEHFPVKSRNVQEKFTTVVLYIFGPGASPFPDEMTRY